MTSIDPSLHETSEGPGFRWPATGHDASMWRFRDRFPVPTTAEPVTLGEGGTPLVRSRLLPSIELWWKDETRNPTGSHKDRALSLAATDAVARGARAMAVVSAGSTGLSNAAYAARAGLPGFCLIGGNAPESRIYPAHALGSTLIRFDCGIDALIAALERLGGRGGLYVASTTRSSNPVQAVAARTIAYEIIDATDTAPDWIVVPTGGGGTIAAIGDGLLDLLAAGLIDRLPRLAAVVPAGFDALREAFDRDIASAAAFAALPYTDDRPTILTKLAHGHPPDGLYALAMLRRTKGAVATVTDAQALDAVGTIGRRDGLYLEPSSAVVLPGLEMLLARGTIKPGERVVAMACGGGFRETFTMTERRPFPVARADLGDLSAVLGL